MWWSAGTGRLHGHTGDTIPQKHLPDIIALDLHFRQKKKERKKNGSNCDTC
jgi:hypothetical protein